MYSAFLISLFVEMFGLPLTIFLLAPLIDVPALSFGLGESHLLALALDVAGVMPLGDDLWADPRDTAKVIADRGAAK